MAIQWGIVREVVLHVGISEIGCALDWRVDKAVRSTSVGDSSLRHDLRADGQTTSLLCRLGWHNDALAYTPMRCRCDRYGCETKGWDVGSPPVPKFSGYLTAAEVRRSKRRGIVPAYITPQVETELRASAVKAQARRKRGPAEVVEMRRKA